MTITRDVILDLLPIYTAGEASADTRALVEQYLQRDPSLAAQARAALHDPLTGVPPAGPSPDAALRSVTRTRRLLTLQRWLLAWALTGTGSAFSFSVSFRNGQWSDLHWAVREHPGATAAILGVAAAFWVAYVVVRRRLRVAGV